MLEEIKTNYLYPEKPCVNSTLDLLLYPARKALNGKEVLLKVENKKLTLEEERVPPDTIGTLFFRVICGLIAILIAPITLAACLIKIYRGENKKIETEFLAKNDSAKSDCGICLDDLTDESENGKALTMKKCDHIFHEKCIQRWLREKNTCPVCRVVAPLVELDHSELEEHEAAVDDFLGTVQAVITTLNANRSRNQKEEELLTLLRNSRFGNLRIKNKNDNLQERSSLLTNLNRTLTRGVESFSWNPRSLDEHVERFKLYVNRLPAS